MAGDTHLLLQALYDRAKLVVFFLSADFSIQSCNKEAEKVFQIKAQEVKAKNFFEVCRQEKISISELHQLIQALSAKQHTARLQTKILQADKTYFLSWDIYPLLDVENNTHYMMLGQDITPFLTTNIYMENIMNHAPGMIFWKDRQSNFLGCNKLVSDLAGLASPQEIVGKSDYDLPWSREESDHYREDDREVILSERPKLNIEETQTLPGGRVRTLLTNKVPLIDIEGKVIGVLGTYSDISELKEKELELERTNEQLRKALETIAKDVRKQQFLEEQLREKNMALRLQNRQVREATRLKSLFLANMSHELRTPLNGIIGFTELMANEVAGPISAEQKEYLEDVLMSSRHLLQLINDILDLSKVEAGKMNFEPELIELEEMIEEVEQCLLPIYADKHIEFSLELDENLKAVVLDHGKFKQILFNYLSNAFKFTAEGGKVWLRVLPQDKKHFRLEVEDTGIGIHKNDLPKLFVQFQQLDSSISKKYQGTGLGLALTRQLVEAQGGSVGVDSLLGKGSTFYVILPYGRLKQKKAK